LERRPCRFPARTPESEIFIAKYRLAAETTTIFESRGGEDGYIRESGDTGVGGIAYSGAADPYAISLGDDNLHRQYVGVLSFDTSTIPLSATISSVTLTLTRSAQVGDDPFASLAPLVVDVKTGRSVRPFLRTRPSKPTTFKPPST
jgi:hypothetical protein